MGKTLLRIQFVADSEESAHQLFSSITGTTHVTSDALGNAIEIRVGEIHAVHNSHPARSAVNGEFETDTSSMSMEAIAGCLSSWLLLHFDELPKQQPPIRFETSPEPRVTLYAHEPRKVTDLDGMQHVTMWLDSFNYPSILNRLSEETPF